MYARHILFGPHFTLWYVVVLFNYPPPLPFHHNMCAGALVCVSVAVPARQHVPATATYILHLRNPAHAHVFFAMGFLLSSACNCFLGFTVGIRRGAKSVHVVFSIRSCALIPRKCTVPLYLIPLRCANKPRLSQVHSSALPDEIRYVEYIRVYFRVTSILAICSSAVWGVSFNVVIVNEYLCRCRA